MGTQVRVLRPNSLEGGRTWTVGSGPSAGDRGRQSPNGYFLPMIRRDRETMAEKRPRAGSQGVREACPAAFPLRDPEQVTGAL